MYPQTSPRFSSLVVLDADWWARYVGIPFKVRGRTRAEGLDCWGLLRFVYAECFGVHVPCYADEYMDDVESAEVARLVAEVEATTLRNAEQSGGYWWKVAPGVPLQDGDAMLVRQMGHSSHVAVYVSPGRLLNTFKGTYSHVEAIDPKWRGRVLGYYRWVRV